MNKFELFVDFTQKLYNTKEFLPLHEPKFIGNEKKYLNECIDSTFVSSVGKFVNEFENMICSYTGAKYAVATVNGTSALHIALMVAGVKRDDEVLTQALTFIATENALSYIGANPVFIDVDKKTLGLSPKAIETFLINNCETKDDGFTYNKNSGKKISACVPMHTFGYPIKIDELIEICDRYNIPVVEDSAESIGSFYKGKMTGTFGKLGIYSFNGNKTITCGGGGVIVTDNEKLAKLAKHMTTTAKVPHKWEFVHDMVGYNYRMPNINAALACAQLEKIEEFIENKRETAQAFKNFAKENDFNFVIEPQNSKSNCWLNAFILEDLQERNEFLEYVNSKGVMARPIWTLMNKLEMFKHCETDGLKNSVWLEERVVNIPSGVR